MTDPENTPTTDEPTAEPAGEDTGFVPVHQADEHGYYGNRPRTTPNEDYTVTGVTGATANVADTPISAQPNGS